MIIDSVFSCTSCGCCAAFCPTQCLEMKLDNNGFYRPKLVSKDKCTYCNLCEKICPSLNQKVNNNNPKAFSVVSNNEDVLKTTSSGGSCFELAIIAISLGFRACSVVYNYDKHIAEHVIISNALELEQTKGSKYMQSYTFDAFSKIMDGSKYIVFGTPCQIAGIENMATLKKMRNNFLLVDFFCHGTPSMKLWKKYISEKDYKKIKKVHFRSKEFGWHKFSFKFEYKDGTCFSDSKRNKFYTFFLGNYCLNDSCYECPYKGLKSEADIRVGDFWGQKYKNIDTGVSVVLAYTDTALKYVEKLKNSCTIKEETVSCAIEGQMPKSPIKPNCRKFVLKAFDTNISLNNIFNIGLLPSRLIRKIKILINR